MMLCKLNAFLAVILLAAFAWGFAAKAEEPPVCAGKDLIAELKAKDPAAYERLAAEAAKIPNGDSVFWRIDGPPGTPPSWLLGTIHLSDPRVVNLPPHIEQALDHARVVAIETADSMIGPNARTLKWRIARFQVLPLGTSLFKLLSQRDADLLRQELAEREYNPDEYTPYQPLLVADVIDYPACELARRSAGMQALDWTILGRAMGKRAVTVSLENSEVQAALFASIPVKDQLAELIFALHYRYSSEDSTETIIQSWRNGRVAEYYVFASGASELTEDERQSTKRVEKVILDDRNAIMRDSALPHLKDGNMFIAVGGFHLFGENGLVELLRKAGYTVTAVDTGQP